MGAATERNMNTAEELERLGGGGNSCSINPTIALALNWLKPQLTQMPFADNKKVKYDANRFRQLKAVQHVLICGKSQYLDNIRNSMLKVVSNWTI